MSVNEIYTYSAANVDVSVDGIPWDGFYSEDFIKITKSEGGLRIVRGIEKGNVAYVRDNEVYKIDISLFRSSFRSRALLQVIASKQDGFYDPVILSITDKSSGQSFNFKAVLDGWYDITMSASTNPLTLTFLASEYTYQQITASGRDKSAVEILSDRISEALEKLNKTNLSIFS